jgi:hypothetical protein
MEGRRERAERPGKHGLGAGWIAKEVGNFRVKETM